MGYIDRQNNPPRTPYQHARRHWLDYVAALSRRCQLEAGDHARREWLFLMAALTAACPRRGHHIAHGQVETTAALLVRDHVQACPSCDDSDWTWFTHPESERGPESPPEDP